MLRSLARPARAGCALLPLATSALLLSLGAACADSAPTDPSPGGVADVAAATPGRAGEPITVMSQNLYPGANLDLVIGALASPDPADDVAALQHAIGTLQATDFPRRAARIADAIARHRPHAVGLQEVAAIAIDLDLGAPISLAVDFLPILQAALAERGLDYVVAAQHLNIVATPIPGVSFSDADVLLVDADRVTIESGAGHGFTADIGVVAPGVDLQRGWVSAVVRIGGERVVIASAHTESGSQAGLAQLRALQVSELVASLPPAVPALLIGDLNDEPGSPMHGVLTGAGLVDVWAALRPGTGGETCCHADDLSNPIADFDQRIDYVFARGFGAAPDRLHGRIMLFGDQPSERAASSSPVLWASDHAGVVATLTMANR